MAADEKVVIGTDNLVESPYRIEVEKNTKGYNFSVKVVGTDVEALKKEVKALVDWCNENFKSS